MKTREVIEQAQEAVKDRFLNYDWYEEAEEAARRIAAGDVALAKRVARAAKKLPAFAAGRPFLFWERLGIRLKEGGVFLKQYFKEAQK